jgi:hypothetical protein
VNINPIDWLTFNCIINTFGQSVDCTENSPAFVWKEDFAFDAEAEYLNFDYKWMALGDGDWMTVFFDDTLLFSFTGTGFSGSDYSNSGLIPIHELAGRTGRLIFSLNSVGGANASFSIKGLSVFATPSGVPEPTTWLTFIIGFGASGALIRRAKRRKRKEVELS